MASQTTTRRWAVDSLIWRKEDSVIRTCLARAETRITQLKRAVYKQGYEVADCGPWSSVGPRSIGPKLEDTLKDTMEGKGVVDVKFYAFNSQTSDGKVTEPRAVFAKASLLEGFSDSLDDRAWIDSTHFTFHAHAFFSHLRARIQ